MHSTWNMRFCHGSSIPCTKHLDYIYFRKLFTADNFVIRYSLSEFFEATFMSGDVVPTFSFILLGNNTIIYNSSNTVTSNH